MPSLSKGTKPRKRSKNSSIPSVPKPKQIRKRSTERHRRATTHVNDQLSDDEESAITLSVITTQQAPTSQYTSNSSSSSSSNSDVVVTTTTSTTAMNASPLVATSNTLTTVPTEDVFSVAATHLDMTETFNFSRSKLHNVIKNAHRQHKRVAQQIRQSVQARAPVLNQCRQALSELDTARIAVTAEPNNTTLARSVDRPSSAIRSALKALADVDRAIRTELQALVTIEEALNKQNDAIVALHTNQVRAYSDARDALVQVCEDPTFVYRIRPSAGAADEDRRYRMHSEGAAAICRDITQHPLVMFATTELQYKHFAL